MDCSICVNKFNKSTLKRVSCPQCERVACTSCYTTFLCERPSEPCCMFCNHPWSDDVLFSRFTKKFVKETLVKHIAENMFKTEVATQLGRPEVVQGAELCRATGVCPTKLKTLVVKSSGKKTVRMYPCPSCTGFVNSATMRCIKCDGEMCSACHMAKPDAHKCKAEDVKTVEVLKRDTKPCPKCHIPIHKIDGCDQMWCIECHTAFSWRTLAIETARIHNPHYNQFMRERGEVPRDPQDILCGGVPDYFHYSVLPGHYMFFENMLRNIHEMRSTHNINGSIAYFQKRIDDLGPKTTARQIKYVLGQISEDEYKKELVGRYNEQRKLRAFVEHVTAHVTALEDLFRNFDYIYNSNKSTVVKNIDMESLVFQCRSLDLLMKQRMDVIRRTYNTAMHPIRYIGAHTIQQ